MCVYAHTFCVVFITLGSLLIKPNQKEYEKANASHFYGSSIY